MATKRLELPAGTTPAALERGTVFFIGTATVLIRYAGFTVLTDPNFLHRGERVSLGYGLHATRRTDPAIELDALPAVDVVLLSHLHGDHFDQLVERRLDHTLPIVTTRHAAVALAHKGFVATHALGTWDTLEVTKNGHTLRVTAAPGRHGPGALSAALPPVMGSILEFVPAHGRVALRIYISGDTLVHDRLREIPARYPDIDLALAHLGGTRVLGLMVTMDGKQGVELIRIVKPRTTIPIHYDDYDRFRSPLDAFKREVERAGLEDRVHYLARGETWNFDVPASRLPSLDAATP